MRIIERDIDVCVCTDICICRYIFTGYARRHGYVTISMYVTVKHLTKSMVLPADITFKRNPKRKTLLPEALGI